MIFIIIIIVIRFRHNHLKKIQNEIGMYDILIFIYKSCKLCIENRINKTFNLKTTTEFLIIIVILKDTFIAFYYL